MRKLVELIPDWLCLIIALCFGETAEYGLLDIEFE